MKKLIYAFLFFSTQLYAADTYLHGTIVDITSVSEGLLIKMDKQSVPDICQNRSPFGWMLIPNDRKAIMAVMLMNWYQKKRQHRYMLTMIKKIMLIALLVKLIQITNYFKVYLSLNFNDHTFHIMPHFNLIEHEAI
jgi:hypothetical protein